MSREAFMFTVMAVPLEISPEWQACKGTFSPVPLYGLSHAVNHLWQHAAPYVYPTLRAYQGGSNNTLLIQPNLSSRPVNVEAHLLSKRTASR